MNVNNTEKQNTNRKYLFVYFDIKLNEYKISLVRTDRLMSVDSLKPNENICDEMSNIKQINKQNRRNIKFYIYPSLITQN